MSTPSWTAGADTRTQILGTGDGYVTLSGTTEQYSSPAIDLTAKFGAHIQVEVDADVTPTDDVDVSVYGSIDGTNWSVQPVSTVRIDTATDPNSIDFVLSGMKYARIGVKQTGATDSHNVRAYVDTWSTV